MFVCSLYPEQEAPRALLVPLLYACRFTAPLRCTPLTHQFLISRLGYRSLLSLLRRATDPCATHHHGQGVHTKTICERNQKNTHFQNKYTRVCMNEDLLFRNLIGRIRSNRILFSFRISPSDQRVRIRTIGACQNLTY